RVGQELSIDVPGRDELESIGRRLRSRESMSHRRASSRGRSRIARRSCDGGLERAQSAGLARRVFAEWQARALLDIRGVRAHRRVDGDTACEMARGVRIDSLAGAGRFAQLPTNVDVLAK